MVLEVKYGDWFPPAAAPDIDQHLVSAAAIIRDIAHVAKLCNAAGDTETAARLMARHAAAASSFNQVWYDPNRTLYGSGEQTEMALPLWLGIVHPNTTDAVVTKLVEAVDKAGGHVTTGIIGARALFPALVRHGRADVAMALATSTSYPSYGYMVSNPHEPATSLWEKWEADQLTHDQQDASRNHIMFGSISTFFWEYFAGIIPTTPGWKTIRVAPTFGERCEGTAVFQPRPNDSLGASLATLAGVVEVAWLWQPDMASINVTLPQGTTGATVVVPCVAAGTTVEEGGQTVWNRQGFLPGGSKRVHAAQRVPYGVQFVTGPGAVLLTFVRRSEGKR